MKSKFCLLALANVMALTACAGGHEPLTTVTKVDLDRFMGDWYVIANIPTFFEKDAYNAVETYALRSDGKIATTFVYRKGGFDGKRKEYNPTATVLDTNSNAIWGMQVLWPVKSDYRIVYLTDDYSRTVIARNKRDYVWIMAREPNIPDTDYREIVEFIASIGYDASDIQKIPQQW